MRHRTGVAYLLALLMIMAGASRMYLTHHHGYYEDYLRTAHPSIEIGAWVSCHCPVCHAEDYLATEAEFFEYHPIIAVLDNEAAVPPIASANRITITSSLRAPPFYR